MKITEMLGNTLQEIRVDEDKEAIIFIGDINVWRMSNDRSDCTSVYVTIEDICGDLNDLVGSPLLMCEEATYKNCDPPERADYESGPGGLPDESGGFTWTFYKFATIKGSVTIRWYGWSNGYYSEEVDFYRLDLHDNSTYSYYYPEMVGAAHSKIPNKDYKGQIFLGH